MRYPPCANIALAMGLAILLGGCSGSSKSSNDGWQHWVCDNRKSFDWRYTDPGKKQIEVRMGKSPIHYLEREYAAVGLLYSDRRIGVHMENNQGLIYRVESDEIIGRRCK